MDTIQFMHSATYSLKKIKAEKILGSLLNFQVAYCLLYSLSYIMLYYVRISDAEFLIYYSLLLPLGIPCLFLFCNSQIIWSTYTLYNETLTLDQTFLHLTQPHHEFHIAYTDLTSVFYNQKLTGGIFHITCCTADTQFLIGGFQPEELNTIWETLCSHVSSDCRTKKRFVLIFKPFLTITLNIILLITNTVLFSLYYSNFISALKKIIYASLLS